MSDDEITQPIAHVPVEERRVRVQPDYRLHGRPAGTVTWSEHLKAYEVYASRYGGSGQSAERIVERGGFGYGELQLFLGHDPTTWIPDNA